MKVQALGKRAGDVGLRLIGIKKGNENEIWAPGTRYFREHCETVHLIVCGKSLWALKKF